MGRRVTIASEQSDKHALELERTGFWGAQAAGALFLARDTKRFLFAHRSSTVEVPNTWGTIGGAIDSGESPEQAVRREIYEESGYHGKIRLIPLVIFRHSSGFKYYNYLAIVRSEFLPHSDKETQGYKWVRFGHWPRPLHPGCRFLLKHSEIKMFGICNSL